MVIDTSAILAILLSEPEYDSLEKTIDRAHVRLVSVASVLEAAILGKRAGALDHFLARFPIEVRAFDIDQLKWARYAFETYGRGRHPAKLNFGDCFSYALAKTTSQPILFKGDDFSQTDLESAGILYP